MDSTFEEHDVVDSMATIKQLPTPARKTPILSLPLELIQQVNTYLDTTIRHTSQNLGSSRRELPIDFVDDLADDAGGDYPQLPGHDRA